MLGSRRAVPRTRPFPCVVVSPARRVRSPGILPAGCSSRRLDDVPGALEMFFRHQSWLQDAAPDGNVRRVLSQILRSLEDTFCVLFGSVLDVFTHLGRLQGSASQLVPPGSSHRVETQLAQEPVPRSRCRLQDEMNRVPPGTQLTPHCGLCRDTGQTQTLPARASCSVQSPPPRRCSSGSPRASVACGAWQQHRAARHREALQTHPAPLQLGGVLTFCVVSSILIFNQHASGTC